MRTWTIILLVILASAPGLTVFFWPEIRSAARKISRLMRSGR